MYIGIGTVVVIVIIVLIVLRPAPITDRRSWSGTGGRAIPYAWGARPSSWAAWQEPGR